MRTKRILCTLPSALSLAVASAVAQTTQSTLEEMIVTGELRQLSVFELANSVSVFDAEDLQTRDANNLEDLLNLAPNVNFSQGASRGRFIQIRGIGERSQFVDPVNPSVGILVDGIDFTGIGTGVTAVDAAQVEVFRGPQGTLFGANALAGMIYVRGQAPGDAPGAHAAATVGNYGRRDIAAAYGSPLTEHLGWRIGAQYSHSDGYIDNDYLKSDETNDINETSLRNHLSLKAGEALTLDLISYYIDIDNGYDAFSLDNNRTTLSDEPGHDRQTNFANAVHVQYAGWNFADLETVATVNNGDTDYGYDEDWSYRAMCTGDPACEYPYSTNDNYQRDNQNYSIDLRLLSKKGEAALSWVAGVYHREQDVHLLRTYTNNFPDDDPNTTLAPDISEYSSDYATQNSALYGQLTWRIIDNLHVISGLRAEQYEAEFSDSNGAEFTPDDDFLGGNITLEYSGLDNTLLYARIARGYKTGGFNTSPEVEPEFQYFDDENMWNYELGYKAHNLTPGLDVQIALFYLERDNIQVKQSQGELDTDGTVSFIEFLSNASGGNNYGLETELNWQLNEQFLLFSSLGLLESEYTDYINVSHVDRDPVTGEGVNLDGRDQAHAPNYQFFSGGEWQINEAFSLRAEVEGKGRYYFSASHNEQSRAYHLINVRAKYDFGRSSLALWLRNLEDTQVETRGFYFGNDPRKGYAAEPYTQKGAPRTIGLSYTIDLF